jgi:flagellar biosynthetic protein FliO
VHAILLAAALAAAPLADPAPAAAAARPPDALATRGGGGTASMVLPGLVLLGLAAAAFVVARRKRAAFGPRLLEVIESAPLGPRRSLVLARVGDELLVLGVSEGGIALLSSRRQADPAPAPSRHESLEDLELRRKLEQGRAGSVR